MPQLRLTCSAQKRLLLQLVSATKKSTSFSGFSRICLTESPGRGEPWEQGCFILKFTFFDTFMTQMFVFSFIQFLVVSVKWKGFIFFTSRYNYISTGCLVCTLRNENIVDASEVQTNGFSSLFIQVLDTGEAVHKIFLIIMLLNCGGKVSAACVSCRKLEQLTVCISRSKFFNI